MEIQLRTKASEPIKQVRDAVESLARNHLPKQQTFVDKGQSAQLHEVFLPFRDLRTLFNTIISSPHHHTYEVVYKISCVNCSNHLLISILNCLLLFDLPFIISVFLFTWSRIHFNIAELWYYSCFIHKWGKFVI